MLSSKTQKKFTIRKVIKKTKKQRKKYKNIKGGSDITEIDAETPDKKKIDVYQTFLNRLKFFKTEGISYTDKVLIENLFDFGYKSFFTPRLDFESAGKVQGRILPSGIPIEDIDTSPADDLVFDGYDKPELLKTQYEPYLKDVYNNIKNINNKLSTDDYIKNNTYITTLEFHGSIDMKSYRIVPANTIICCLTPMSYLTYVESKGDKKNAKTAISNMTNEQYIELFKCRENIGKLPDSSSGEINNYKVSGDSNDKINCFRHSMWYYPGQLYPNDELSTLFFESANGFKFIEYSYEGDKVKKISTKKSIYGHPFYSRWELPRQLEYSFNLDAVVNHTRMDTTKKLKLVIVTSCRYHQKFYRINVLLQTEFINFELGKIANKDLPKKPSKPELGLDVSCGYDSNKQYLLGKKNYHVYLLDDSLPDLSKKNINYNGFIPGLMEIFYKIKENPTLPISNEIASYISNLSPVKFAAFLIKLNETPETKKYQNKILNNILIHKEAFTNIHDKLIDYSSYLKVPMISQKYYKVTMKYYDSIYQNLIYLRGIFEDMEQLDFSMYNIRELIDALHNKDLSKIDIVSKFAHKSEESKIHMMESKFVVPNNPEEIYSLVLFNINLTTEEYQEIKGRFSQLKDLYIYNNKTEIQTKMPKFKNYEVDRFPPLETLTLENELLIPGEKGSGVINFVNLIPSIDKLTLKNIIPKKKSLALNLHTGNISTIIKSLEIINSDYKIEHLYLPSLDYIKITENFFSEYLYLSISQSMREITIDEITKIKEVNLIPTNPGNVLLDLHIKHIYNDGYKKINIMHNNPYIENIYISDCIDLAITGTFRTNKLKITRCINLAIPDQLANIKTLDIDSYSAKDRERDEGVVVGEDLSEHLFKLCEKCTNIIYLKNIEIPNFKIKADKMTTYFSNCKRIVTHRKNVADDILWQLNTPEYQKISILREL